MSIAVVRDVLNSKPFQTADLTEAVNDIIPYKPGQASGMVVDPTVPNSPPVWAEEPLYTDVAYIEERQGVLSLIPTSQRGGPSAQVKPGKRTMRPVQTYRLSEEDQINASEIFRVTQFHTAAALENLANVRNQRLGIMADAMDLTLEHLHLNAFKGVVIDADGSTLTDLFALFGVTQDAEIAFDLSNATEGTLYKKLAGIKRKMLNYLEADAARTQFIRVLSSPEFFDDVCTNVDVRAWAKVAPNSQYLAESRVFGVLKWQGFIFEEYRLGSIASGVGGSWIDADKCVLFPVGASIFTTLYSPGEFFGALGTQGLPRYARAAADAEWDEYVKLKLQSYPLPICTRPRVLMKGKRGS